MQGEKMTVIIHDLKEAEWREFEGVPQDAVVISNNGSAQSCIGCFGCWVKTPGQCAVLDGYQKMGELLGHADELVIISNCSFGSYSSFVKKMMDRSISYVLPYFEMRGGEMHHKARYQNHLRMRVYFYGENVTEAEKRTAEQLVAANADNFLGIVDTVAFTASKQTLKEAVTW